MLKKNASILSLLLMTMMMAGCVENLPLPEFQTGNSDPTPRISLWPGKVNQHNENGTWMTDPDGISGGHSSTDYPTDYGDRKLEYCQKWWPATVSIDLRPDKETITFYTAGNTDAYVSTKEVWECVMDSDGDGIDDKIEGDDDFDNDGLPNHKDEDSDGDGIPDENEGISDHDGDGESDYIDEDSDGDGILDSEEGDKDTDEDGESDYIDEDSDNDGIDDKIEGMNDTDGDGESDYVDEDSDGDGHPDEDETAVDTDNDGVPDYKDGDSDDDGESDSNETGDSDQDGIDDRIESDDDDKDGDGEPDESDNYNEDGDGDGVSDHFDNCPGTPDGAEVNGYGCEYDIEDKKPVCEFYHHDFGTPVETHGVLAWAHRPGGLNLLLTLDAGHYSLTLYCADPNGDEFELALSSETTYVEGNGTTVMLTDELLIDDGSPLMFRYKYTVYSDEESESTTPVDIAHMMDACGNRYESYGYVANVSNLTELCAIIDPTPRVAGWPGKVNLHNENGTWKTDPDGKSGWHSSSSYSNDYNDRILDYCQKWWPDSIDYKLRPWRESLIFYTAGNSQAYSTIKDVYECIIDDRSKIPRISYWQGKVNQHNENGTWMTDPDGVSGAGIDMLEYCRKWWPDTESVRLMEERETITFWTRGNTDPYESTRDVYECVQPSVTGGVSDPISASFVQFSSVEDVEIDTIGTIILTSIFWIVMIVVIYIRNAGESEVSSEKLTNESED